MQKKNRTDRILIIIALAILLLATGMFYFDDWMWGSNRKRSERIGIISQKTGDVRMKFEGDLKWGRAVPGQDLIYNDSIYAGGASQAKLQLGQSEMTVSENTLIVLRRDENINFLNLAYGNLFGKIAKNEKMIIDTGDGKPLELLTSSEAHITLTKKGSHTEMNVDSGVVDLMIDGKKTRLDKDSRVGVDGKGTPKLEAKAGLVAVRPLRDQIIYSSDPAKLNFEWKYTTGRRPANTENFIVEFSASANFNQLHFKREVKGQLGTTLNVSDSLSLYYRVRGPSGELSNVEKVNFVRLNKPVIVKPIAKSQFLVPAERKALVEIEFRAPAKSTIWYQIASDPKFESVTSYENTKELKATREFTPGNYFIRAKADFGDNRETSWTEPVPFSVDHKIEVLDLNKAPLQTNVIIPNVNYPANLYKAANAQVKEYLSKLGLLKDFFPFPAGSYDKLNLQFDNSAKVLSQSEPAWPQLRMLPGRHIYKYQTTKQGYKPSPWSEDKKLDISMEAPRPVGDVQYGEVNRTGEADAHWAFTPLLFAKSYDVELSHDPYMRSATKFKVEQAEVKTRLTGTNYWRVRARDDQGRVISEFSSINKLSQPVPKYITRGESEKSGRRPAATERTSTRTERYHEEPYMKNGWWAWFGAGENYVDYRQSVPGRGTLTDSNVKGPSEYVETGFMGQNNWGGVFSYKQTPGEIHPNNAPIDNGSYKWTTVGIEGILRKTSPFTVFGTPVVYGLRLGVQQHRLPFVFLDSDAQLQMKSTTMTSASAGVLAEWTRARWTYYWLMRYQYPLSSQADGASEFTIKPVFAFDGSVGSSYNFSRQLKLGLFWYGQWHQFNFVYADPNQTNPGFQSLFYSNVDLRLGWDF